MVAEEKVASTRRIALPSVSPLTELDVRISLGRARCGPAREFIPVHAAKARAACGEDRERISPSCPVSHKRRANPSGGPGPPPRVARPSMLGGERCLAQGRQRPRPAPPSKLAECPTQPRHAPRRTLR